jgi:hypothetical protein
MVALVFIALPSFDCIFLTKHRGLGQFPHSLVVLLEQLGTGLDALFATAYGLFLHVTHNDEQAALVAADSINTLGPIGAISKKEEPRISFAYGTFVR